MYSYRISTGELTRNGDFVGTGYSGNAAHRNDVNAVSFKDQGPIPPGEYRIGLPYQHPVEGPCVMNLEPSSDTNTFGRSAFHIHGDNARHDASHGCIILGPAIRSSIANSGDTKLQVIE